MTIETIPLNDHLQMIVGTNRGRFPMSHVFVVVDEVCALIETGCGLDLLAEVKEAFRIDLIINSHGHPDHCAGNWLFPDVPLHVPRQGAESNGRLEALSHRFFGHGALAEHWRKWIRGSMGFQDREPTDIFDDGHVFDFGRLKLQAVYTPGHTIDHYCLFEAESGLLLSFDIDLTPFGPWYGNVESNLADFRASIARVRDLQPAAIASSHGDPVFDDVESRLNAFTGVLDQRSDAIRKLVEQGLSREELVDAAPIYGRHPYEPELLRWFEGRMIDLHLEEIGSPEFLA